MPCLWCVSPPGDPVLLTWLPAWGPSATQRELGCPVLCIEEEPGWIDSSKDALGTPGASVAGGAEEKNRAEAGPMLVAWQVRNRSLVTEEETRVSS